MELTKKTQFRAQEQMKCSNVKRCERHVNFTVEGEKVLVLIREH
jgi:hypothetical protein